MAKSKTGLRIVFILLCMFTGFFAAAIIASLRVERTGMAGSANVFLYGMAGVVAGALIGAIIAARVEQNKLIKYVVSIAVVVLLILAWFVYRLRQVS